MPTKTLGNGAVSATIIRGVRNITANGNGARLDIFSVAQNGTAIALGNTLITNNNQVIQAANQAGQMYRFEFQNYGQVPQVVITY